MSIQEAIEHGKEQLEIFGGEHKEFIQMAIKSLEAWGKIKKEIEQESDFVKDIWEKYPDEWYAGKCNAYGVSLEIIDKHLAEVEE